MRLRFLGTGTSSGVPVIGCRCRVCTSDDPRDSRLRTSAVLEFTDHTGAGVSDDVLRPMIEVRPEYIRACFDEIRKRYESREHFFETALDLDEASVDSLKDRYLE